MFYVLVLMVVAGVAFEPRSLKPLSFYHSLPLEGRPWNGCQRCPFPVKQTGNQLEAIYAKVSKEGSRVGAGWSPQAAGPHYLASCHHGVLDRTGCVLQRHSGYCTSWWEPVKEQSVRFHRGSAQLVS